MSNDELLAFILRVFRIFDSFGGLEPDGDLWWRTDAPEYAPVTFMINCNDVFYWASADCERLTPENIGELERAVADCKSAYVAYADAHPTDSCFAGLSPGRRKGLAERLSTIHADTLFVARVRGMRPQGAYYKHIPRALWPLFDKAGPERSATEPGNTPRPDAA